MRVTSVLVMGLVMLLGYAVQEAEDEAAMLTPALALGVRADAA